MMSSIFNTLPTVVMIFFMKPGRFKTLVVVMEVVFVEFFTASSQTAKAASSNSFRTLVRYSNVTAKDLLLAKAVPTTGINLKLLQV